MKSFFSKIITAFTVLFLPSFLARYVLNFLGHNIGLNCSFGFSIILVDAMLMQQGAKVGHFNFIKVNRLLMRKSARIGRMNIIKGPLSVLLSTNAAIGNANKILRAGPVGVVTIGSSYLKLGELSKITSNHYIDCTKTIRLGAFTTLAGIGSQIWTHGYIHELVGADRYRIDSKVEIGDNVYIGAGCIISMGVKIASGVIVGAGVTVAKNLDEAGLYVSSAIRQLPRPLPPDQRSDLMQITKPRLSERVYAKSAK